MGAERPHRVLHHADGLLVVDKPAGLPTQATRDGADNLYDRLRAAFAYVALHHRLDTWASGLLLFSVQRRRNAEIAQALRDHSMGRGYQAVLYGRLDGPCSWSWPLDGKPARTEVSVLAQGHGLSLVRLRLHSGRTHQLRRHAAMAGLPIVGDRRYGGAAARRWPRLALHAAALRLGEHRWNSPIPADLDELWGPLSIAPRTGPE